MTKDHHLTILIKTGARQIRAIVTANTVPNSKTLDKAAVLTAWNSTTHPHDWTANSPNAKAPTTYRGVADKYAIPHKHSPFSLSLSLSLFLSTC